MEVALLDMLTHGFPRSPLQCNRRHESDAELIRLPGGTSVLALTTDALSEEIESGLYADPYQIGWMTVLVNASDLAAVGADPLGILLNQTLPPGLPDQELEELQRGIGEACIACRLPVLGGDTNAGHRLHMGACALGLIDGGRLLTRRGAAPGDRLFASGRLGLGGAFALSRMMQPVDEPPTFRPQPRLREGRLVRGYASSCMDTSDGAIVTLDELSRLNGVGFDLRRPVEDFLHPVAVARARQAGLPPWFMLAGPHGEFELLFTIPEPAVKRFRAAAQRLRWEPLELGVVSQGRGTRLQIGGRSRYLDTLAVRDAYTEAGADPRAYVERLWALNDPVAAGGNP